MGIVWKGTAEHLCFHRSGRNTEDTDVGFTSFLGETSSKLFYECFCCAVGHESRKGIASGKRGDVDDDSAARRSHDWPDGSAGVEDGGGVCGEHAVEIIDGGIGGLGADCHCGVVDQQLDWSKVLCGVVDGGGNGS